MTHWSTAKFFTTMVLPAFRDFKAADRAMDDVLGQQGPDTDDVVQAKLSVLRQASNCAIAIDGLRDRWAKENGVKRKDIDSLVAPFCTFEDGSVRADCLKRIRGTANAFKHAVVDDPDLPIASEDGVVVLGRGFGLDGFGVGKYDGIEVLTQSRDGKTRCFSADARCSIRGWATVLTAAGHDMPNEID